MALTKENTVVLNLVIPYMPYYGEFDLLGKVGSVEDSKFKEVYDNLSNPEGQVTDIRFFLVENGYAINRSEINELHPDFHFIELTERGRWLKQCGSMELYREYQVQKKEKARIDEEERATAVQRNIQMNRLTSWIAVATVVAAVYYLLEIVNHIWKIYPN